MGYHVCFLFLRVLRCFSSPRAPSLQSDRSLHLPGCPIRKSVDHCALAAPYRVSPLGTSFIGTLPLGIPQKPCLTLNTQPPHTHSLPPPRRQGKKKASKAQTTSPALRLTDQKRDRSEQKMQAQKMRFPKQITKDQPSTKHPHKRCLRLSSAPCTLYFVVKEHKPHPAKGNTLSQDLQTTGAFTKQFLTAPAQKYTVSHTVCQGETENHFQSPRWRLPDSNR